MENTSVKMFSLPRDVVALSGVSSKNTSRAALNAVHFDGKNAMASDGHRLALVPFDNPELAGVSLNLGEVKKPKSAYIVFTKTGETRFLSEVGPADVVDCAPPDYNAVIPTVSPESHQAIAINVDYLLGLYKAIDSDNKGDKKGILTLLISKQSNLDGIGVVSSNSGGIGVLMPCRPFGGAGFPDAFQKFAAISGQNTIEGQIRAVEELKRQIDAGELGITPEVAEGFSPAAEEKEHEREATRDEADEVGEIRARFMEALRNEAKAAIEDVWSGLAEEMRQEIEEVRQRYMAEAEAEAAPLDDEGEEETEGGEIPEEEEAEAAPLSSDVAAVFHQPGEVADAFKPEAKVA